MAKCDTTAPSGQVDLCSDRQPWQRHHVAKCDTTAPLGQVDLWSDVRTPVETSCGQVVLLLWSGHPLVRQTPLGLLHEGLLPGRVTI